MFRGIEVGAGFQNQAGAGEDFDVLKDAAAEALAAMAKEPEPEIETTPSLFPLRLSPFFQSDITRFPIYFVSKSCVHVIAVPDDIHRMTETCF